MTGHDLDAIESIDTVPEVRDSFAFVPESIIGAKVQLRKTPSENIPEERYLSLIASSPSTPVDTEPTPVLEEESSNLNTSNAHKILANTRRSLTDLIIPTPEISEALSVPRKPNVRRTNDYVKTKPKLEKLRFPTSHNTSGIVRETPL